MKDALTLLEEFKNGKISAEEVLTQLEQDTSVDLGFAHVDIHRGERSGFSEVIYGEGKTPEQVLEIATQIFRNSRQVLITRITAAHVEAMRARFPKVVYHETARCLTLVREALPKRPLPIAVLCAGTSDLPVAEEAAVTAEIMGNEVIRLYDVGVAGIRRLLGNLGKLRKASVLVVVAGMEGALPSVVAGLVSKPVIAVPTSVGYGASLGGIAALLGMLNSCGSGVTVVNIDNGFGAAYAASQINSLTVQTPAVTEK
ncbi:MAG: nickel pincer cofactor biosynthesis protein LarB [Clostridia bacterium]|nr:nickel pincer cofactor biosynthesis protein LarB [Clostridia bacterium]